MRLMKLKSIKKSHFEVYDLTVENLKEEYLEDFKNGIPKPISKS